LHHKYLCGSLVAHPSDDGGTHPWSQTPVQPKKSIPLLDETNYEKKKMKILSNQFI